MLKAGGVLKRHRALRYAHPISQLTEPYGGEGHNSAAHGTQSRRRGLGRRQPPHGQSGCSSDNEVSKQVSKAACQVQKNYRMMAHKQRWVVVSQRGKCKESQEWSRAPASLCRKPAPLLTEKELVSPECATCSSNAVSLDEAFAKSLRRLTERAADVRKTPRCFTCLNRLHQLNPTAQPTSPD